MRKRRQTRQPMNVVGVLGELLLTTGVVVLLFLSWQLWWNDAILAKSQSSAAADLSDTWSTSAATATPTPRPSQSAKTSPLPNAVDYGEPAALGYTPEASQAFAIMYVPRFGANTQRQVAQGVGTDVLNSTRLGVGHYADSSLPGEVGNFAIAAHRSAYGGGMHLIDKLQVGDPIYIQTEEGWYTYRFRNFEYVRASAVGVIDSVPQGVGEAADARLITLTTCNPLYSTSERIIAYGVFDSWQPPAAGPPEAIAADVESWNQ